MIDKFFVLSITYMRILFFFLLIYGHFMFSQNESLLIVKDSLTLKAVKLHGIDGYGNLYYTAQNNSFTKKTNKDQLTYSNFQLGELTSANPFNPLKINVFYRDFNTIILLDNRLAEIIRLDFNQIQPFRNLSNVSTGYDSTLWLFNQDTQQLELFDYSTLKTKLKTIPVQSQVLDLKSDYNYCYMLTERFLYIYNYFGSLIKKIENKGYQELNFSKGLILLRNNNDLYIYDESLNLIKPLKIPNLLIKQFLVTDETLYIYDDENLRRYQLKTP